MSSRDKWGLALMPIVCGLMGCIVGQCLKGQYGVAVIAAFCCIGFAITMIAFVGGDDYGE